MEEMLLPLRLDIATATAIGVAIQLRMLKMASALTPVLNEK